MTPGRCRAAGLCVAILTIWCFVTPSPTATQAVSSVSGAVIDQHGAVIADAEMRLHDLDTGVERRAATNDSDADIPLPIQNTAGLQLLVAREHTSPVLCVILPGRPTSDRSIEILFPEHVTVRKQGQRSAEQLYLFGPGLRDDRPRWRRSSGSLEYERDLGAGVHLLARATLESDGVRFHYEFTNDSQVAYEMIYAPTDPRLTSIFHDVRLERTYVHHADGFDLLASETPRRLTIPLDQWLPARYLVSFTWPVPAQRIERREDGITYYNKSRAVDASFIATVSTDKAWVIASFARTAGNVWSNPELTCQHVDPQPSLSAGQRTALETKMLVIRGSLDAALERAIQQRESLK
jgi:hypothetical protein